MPRRAMQSRVDIVSVARWGNGLLCRRASGARCSARDGMRMRSASAAARNAIPGPIPAAEEDGARAARTRTPRALTLRRGLSLRQLSPLMSVFACPTPFGCLRAPEVTYSCTLHNLSDWTRCALPRPTVPPTSSATRIGPRWAYKVGARGRRRRCVRCDRRRAAGRPRAGPRRRTDVDRELRPSGSAVSPRVVSTLSYHVCQCASDLSQTREISQSARSAGRIYLNCEPFHVRMILSHAS